MFRLSTLIPEGNQPRTEKDTEAEVGIRLALIWALVLRGVARDVEEEGMKKAGSWEEEWAKDGGCGV
jgi:hypothetical protein